MADSIEERTREIIARFLARSSTTSNKTEFVIRSLTPSIAKFLSREDDAHLMLVANAFSCNINGTSNMSNVILLGNDAANDEAYISTVTTEHQKLARFHTHNITFDADTIVNGPLLQTSNNISDISGWHNAYFATDDVLLNNASISYRPDDNSSIELLDTDAYPAKSYLELNIKELKIEDTNSHYYSILSASPSGVLLTSYTSNDDLIRELNIGQLDTSMFPEDQNGNGPKYFKEQYITDLLSGTSTIDTSGTSNALLQNLDTVRNDFTSNISNQYTIITNSLLQSSNASNIYINQTLQDLNSNIKQYITNTSNTIIQTNSDTSNAIITAAGSNLKNLSLYADATSNAFGNLLVTTSNAFIDSISSNYTNISNLADTTSNKLSDIITTTSNTISDTYSSNYTREYSRLEVASNLLLANLEIASNALLTALSDTSTNISNLVTTTSNNITTNLTNASNSIYFTNYNAYTDSASNIITHAIDTTSNAFVDKISKITLENVKPGSSNKFIVDNIYKGDLLVSNLTTIGNILPSSNLAFDIGSETMRWKDLYLAQNSIYLGNTIVSVDAATNSMQVTSSTANTSVTVSKIKLADATTANFTEIKYEDGDIQATSYKQDGNIDSAVSTRKTTDMVPEGSSNLYFKSSLAAPIVGASNLVSSNYASNLAISTDSRISNLNADQINISTGPNKFIQNNRFTGILTVNASMQASNLSVTDTLTDIQTDIYQTENIVIQGNDIFSIRQSYKTDEVAQVVDFKKNTAKVMTMNQYGIGIGLSANPVAAMYSDSNALYIKGDTLFTTNLNDISSNQLSYIKGLTSSVQSQINTKNSSLNSAGSSSTAQFDIDLTSFKDYVNTVLYTADSNVSNYAKKMIDYFSATPAGQLQTTSNTIATNIKTLDSDMSNYVKTSSNLLSSNVTQAFTDVNTYITGTDTNASNYVRSSSNTFRTNLIATSNLLNDRISYISQTGFNIYFNSNVAINSIPIIPTEKLDIAGSIGFTGNLNTTATSNQVRQLKGLTSPLQTQITNMNTYNSNYVQTKVRDQQAILDSSNSAVTSVINAHNTTLTDLRTGTFATLNTSRHSKNDQIDTNIAELNTRGYTQWLSSTPNIYITSNIAIGSNQVSSGYRVEIGNGDVNINTFQAQKKTIEQTGGIVKLEPVAWYQFNQDPSEDVMNDSNVITGGTKYNLKLQSFFHNNNNLPFWYRFDTAASFTTNSGYLGANCNLTMPGGANNPTLDTSSNIVGTGAANFANSNYVNIPVYDYNTGTTAPTAYTFSFWLQKNGLQTGGGDIILTDSQATPKMLIQRKTTTAAWNLNFFGSGIIDTSVVDSGGSRKLEDYTKDDVWNHYAIIAQKSGTAVKTDIYKNGTLAYSPNSAGAWSTTTADYNKSLRISDTVGKGLLGKLDDFRIYNKALTASEVGIVMNQCVNNGFFNDTTNLEAWYKFDNASDITASAITDYSGKGKNGTNVGGAYESTIKAKGNGSIYFNRALTTKPYVQLPSINIPSIQAATGFTVSAWFYSTTNTPAAGRVFEFALNTANFFSVERTGESQTVYNIYIIASGSVISVPQVTLVVNTWNHISISVSTGNIWTIYFNNVNRNVTINRSTNFLGSTPLIYISNSVYGSTYTFDGYVDDFRIYNKALTAAEVAVLYYNSPLVQKTTLYTTPSYLYQNALTWNGTSSADDNVHLAYTDAANIKALLGNFHTKKAFSIHFLFKTASITSTSELFFIGDKSAAANTAKDLIRVHISNSTLNFRVSTGITAANYTLLKPNLTYIVALTFSYVTGGNMTLKMYLNGLLVDTETATYGNVFTTTLETITDANLVYRIGKYIDTDTNDATPVTLQDFRVFANELTPKQVADLKTSIYNYTEPLVWYRFNDDPTTTANVTDSSSLVTNVNNYKYDLQIDNGFFNDTINLEAWWKFDDSANLLVDSSGKSRTLTNYRAGFDSNSLKMGTGSIKFDKSSVTSGDKPYATIPNIDIKTIQTANGISFCFWFKENTANTLTSARVFEFARDASGSPSYGYIDFDKGTTTSWNCTLRDAASSTVPIAVNAGAWNHIVWNISSTGVWTVYANNINQNVNVTKSITFTTISGNNYLANTFFKGQFGDNYTLDGNIDDFRIYNKVLTAVEIAVLYNTNKSKFTNYALTDYPLENLTDLKAWYRFPSSSILSDFSGQGNTLDNSAAAEVSNSVDTIVDGSAQFGGSSFLSITNNAKFSLDTFTVACWCKIAPATGATALTQTIASCVVQSTNWFGWDIQVNYRGAGNNTNDLIIATQSGTSTIRYATSTQLIPSIYKNFATATASWIHMAITINKTGNIAELYINGRKNGNNIAINYSNNTHPTNFVIGADSANTDNNRLLSGSLLADFRFYSRVLSPTEVLWIYSQTFKQYYQNGGLVAWYRFDGTAAGTTLDIQDYSGNNYALTNTQATVIPKTTTAADLKKGTASAAFNGTGYLDVASAPFLVPNFTVACWCKIVTGTKQTIVSCWKVNTNFFGWDINVSSGNALQFDTGINTNTVTSSGSKFASFAAATATWRHLAVTVSIPNTAASSSAAINIYVDGVSQGSFNQNIFLVSTTAASVPDKLTIGGRNHTSVDQKLQTGSFIDDFRFYNKVLTAAEISQIYAPTTGYTIQRWTGYPLNAYSSAYMWDGNTATDAAGIADNNWLAYTGSTANIQNLLKIFHNQQAFTIHFLFSTTNITSAKSEILYIGKPNEATAVDYIRVYVNNGSLYFVVGTLSINSAALVAGNFYTADLEFSLDASGNILTKMYLYNETTSAAITPNVSSASSPVTSYSDLFNVASATGLVYYMGKYDNKSSADNAKVDASPLTLQDFRIYPSILPSNELTFLQTTDDVKVSATTNMTIQSGEIPNTDFKYYAFTATGSGTNGTGSITFSQPTVCDVLLVGGGGSGGTQSGGGGGAGSLIYLTAQSFSTGTYTVVIGSGGQGILGSSTVASGINGDDSYIQRSGTDIYRAKGGGGGGKGYPTPAQAGNGDLGISGGSSGGTGGGNTNLANAVVTNNVPVGSYGNRGGSGSDGSVVFSSAFAGGGGGGSGSVGGNATINKGQDSAGGGGTGTTINIYGNNVTYAAGGGGGVASSSNGTSGSGGSSIGGNGSKGSTAASIGLAGTGSGGGGGGWDASNNNRANSGAGGSGIVIIRFAVSKSSPAQMVPASAFEVNGITTTTTYPNYQAQRWKDGPLYYDSQSQLKHITYGDGRVGINLSAPDAKLHVGSTTPVAGASTGTTSYTSMTNSATLASSSTAITNVCSIFDSSILVTGKVASSSDIRIKKNILDINDDSALQKILNIEPKTYDYIDNDKNTAPSGKSGQPGPPDQSGRIYGFIAQQVKEVLPEAVSSQKDIIPNIYSLANVTQDASGGSTITFASEIPQLAINDKVDIVDTTENRGLYTITATNPENNSITVDKLIPGSQVFVYGTQVDDFNVVDKSYIYTLNVCATQTLADKINLLKNRISSIRSPSIP
jgi:hypothetical protein